MFEQVVAMSSTAGWGDIGWDDKEQKKSGIACGHVNQCMSVEVTLGGAVDSQFIWILDFFQFQK